MKILAIEIETPGAQSESFQPFLRQEAYKVWELYQSGVVREAYFDAEQHTAVLVLECSNTDEARAVLGSLPLVKAGLIGFDLIPLVPYDGFARLFGSAE